MVQHLQDFLNQGSVEAGTRLNAKSYKLDEAAEWKEWAETDMNFKGKYLTGPEAPRAFHICERQDLSPDETEAPFTAWPGAPTPNGRDVVVALRQSMSDRRAFQVALLVPFERAEFLRRRAADGDLQPEGIHPRRPVRTKALAERHKMVRTATECHRTGHLTDKARAYLVDWAIGIRHRELRPQRYTFLDDSGRRSRAEPTRKSSDSTVPLHCTPLPWDRQPRPIEIVPEGVDGGEGDDDPEEETGENEELLLVEDPAA